MVTDGEMKQKVSMHILFLKEKLHYIKEARMSGPFKMYSSRFPWGYVNYNNISFQKEKSGKT